VSSSGMSTGRASRAESTASARRALIPSAELDLVTVGMRGGQPAANTELGGDRGGIRRGQKRLPADGTVSRRLLQISAPRARRKIFEELDRRGLGRANARDREPGDGPAGRALALGPVARARGDDLPAERAPTQRP